MTSFWFFRHCATLTEYFLKIYIFFSNASNSCFRLSETFFRKFFKCLQRVPLHFFLFFQRMDVQKLPNAHFYICRHYATYRGPKKFKKNFKKKFNFFLFFPHVGFVEENTWHIEVLLLFLSLRYGATWAVPSLLLFRFCLYFHAMV